MRRLFNEDLDELAAYHHEGRWIRIFVTVGISLTALTLMPWTYAAGWLAFGLCAEVWNFFATRPQFLRQTITTRHRLNHVAVLSVVSAQWFFLGVMYWNTQTVEGAACAITIWVVMVCYAQSFAFQSPLGYLISGALPLAGMLLTVFAFPSPAFADMRPVWATLVLGALFAVAGVRQTLDTRRWFKEATERAEAAAQAKSDFLANMTHELRTPLNAITGFSHVLKSSPTLGAKDARHVGLIHNASGMLLSVVNSVLDFSKLEAGDVDLEPTPFDPAEMIQSVVNLMEGQARGKDLGLTASFDGQAERLLGDAPRLRQVLLNFLSNAIKFTSHGGVKVEAKLAGEGETRRLSVSVIDNGIGIPANKIEHVFGRFTQADASTSRRFGGTGLGLAISKGLIEQMGGQIGADSVEGEGSTFWFHVDLPLAGENDVAAPVEDEAELEGAVKLLLVEDNPVNRELMLALLGGFDVEITIAGNGVEAIAAAQKSEFDLILMDVQMPVMDGMTATRHIRALTSPGAVATPIIAMTANVMPEQIERCLAAGMNDHIGKPINPGKLLNTISRWAQVSRAQRADCA